MRTATHALVALAVLGGCGGAGGGVTGGAADLAAGPTIDATSASDSGSVDGDAKDCADDLGARARGGQCVRSVAGRLAAAGAPVADALVTVCAAACFYGKSGADGAFVVDIGQYIEVELYALLAHVNPRRAVFYQALPAPVGGRVTLAAPVEAAAMPEEGPELADDGSAQTLAQSGVTLTIQQGTRRTLSFEDASDLPLGARVRPLRVTDPAAAPFARLDGAAPAVAYGFGPFEVTFDHPVRLGFDNVAGLPASAAVEVWGQRGLLGAGPPGWRFDRVAAAHVTPDGSRVELDPGEGLTTLTWIALRRAGP